MARWSQEMYLMRKGTGDAYAKVIDIKDYPDLGSDPDQIETTTLSETRNRTYILGLQDPGQLTFTANYTKADYDALKLLEDGEEADYALFFGDATGTDGTWYFPGLISSYLLGKGVNEVAEIQISITPTGAITESP